MSTDPYPPMRLHLRLTRSPNGAVRIEHAYSRTAEPDEYRPWAQVPSASTRIRRVWNELRVLVAIWLERERIELEAMAQERAALQAEDTSTHLG